eukprot:1398104-Amphidinium_carterae.1
MLTDAHSGVPVCNQDWLYREAQFSEAIHMFRTELSRMTRRVKGDRNAVTCGDRSNHVWLKTVKEDPTQLVREARATDDELASRVIAKCHCRADATVVVVVFLNCSGGQGDRQEGHSHRRWARLGKQESVVQ